MNLASRPLSFFRSLLHKKYLLGALTLLLSLSLTFSPRVVFAQPQPATPAPAAGTAAPGSVPARTPAAGASGTNSATDINFADAVSGASSFDCDGAGGCLLGVVGFVITLIFSVISYFLSKLLIVLTSVLITFARYNKFNNAPPVEIGWVIVRDISNMFFIVILLISAFMTIIGKAEDYGFHYGKVIPKLLIAAVLVNFSRMIVLLMIDFSQVVMLTFVSAFEGTIAGNLVQGFGVPQMTQLQRQTAGGDFQAVATNLLNVCIAYILSIFLLATAVATLLLYVGYFIFRIIALWMLIIFSPMVFLAGGLPDKASKMLGSITNEFWGKLTSILTGGPLIAFFLWLTFATIQQTASSGLAQTANMGFDFPAGTPSFLTEIGTAPQLASFIVAVAMMVMGFGIATSTAKKIDGLGGIVTFVEKQKTNAFNALARAPWTMAKGAGRGIGRGARAGAGALDRRFGLSNALASGMARGGAATGATGVARVLGGAGGAAGNLMRFIPGVGGVLAAGGAATLAARGAGLKAEQKKKMDERLKSIDSLPPAERAIALRRMNESAGADLLMGPELNEAMHERLGKDDVRNATLKGYEAEASRELEAKELESVGSVSASRKEEIGRQAAGLASARLAQEESGRIQSLRASAIRSNDSVRVAALDKEVTKRMAQSTPEDYQKQIDAISGDSSLLKEVDPALHRDGRFAFALMQKAGATDGKGTMIDPTRFDRLKETFKGNKELLGTFDVIKKQIEGSKAGTENRQLIEGASRREDGDGAQRLYSTKDSGKAIYTDKENESIQLLQSQSPRAAGQPLSDAHRSAIATAIENKLPIGKIQSLVDVQGDNATVAHLATMAAETVTLDPEKALKQLTTLLEAAEKLNASKDQMAAIVQNGLGDSKNAERLFVGSSEYSGSGQKNVAKVLTYAVKSEENPAVKSTLQHVRSYIYPEQATEPLPTGRTKTVTTVEKVKTGKKIPVMKNGEQARKIVNGTPVLEWEDEVVEQKVTTTEEIKEKRVASGVVRQILRVQSIDT